jgi:transposase InsO family protein
MNQELAERIALFRFGVIAPLVDRHLSRGERERIIEQIESATWQIPGSQRTSIGRSTLEKWLSCYRRSGGDIESLKPRARSDKGNSRSIDPETEAALVGLKQELPDYSLQALLSIARRRNIIDSHFRASRQSIYRMFARHGLERTTQGKVDRRKFEAELPNDLWQSDCMHGPKVLIDGVRRKTYLFAIIDDHSRLIPHAQFYLHETIDCFRDCLIQALEKRGLPRRLYTDNASAFRTHQLRYGCASLGIALLHCEPGVPEGRGKIERLYRTIRSQLLPLLSEATSVEELNNHLSQWIEKDYHQRKHSSTGQTPLERYLAHLKALRQAPKDIRDYFRVPAVRKVDKDRSVSLKGRLFEAPVGLIGQSVTLLYHKSDLSRVEVFLGERSYGFLTPLDAGINSKVRRIAKHIVELVPNEQLPPQRGYQGGSLFNHREDQQ